MLEVKALGRILWRNRAASAATIFMLAAAAAAATTTFALADAVLWRDLPYRDPWQLAVVVTRHANGEGAVSLQDLTLLREKAGKAQVAAAGATVPEYALTGFGDPRQLRGRVLTADYFHTLGVRIVAGRDFRLDEERPGSGTVAIITDDIWSELFGRREAALGAALSLNGRSYTIVGILAPHRDPFGDVDIYVPHQFAPTLSRRFRVMTPIARLTGTASFAEFREEAQRLTTTTDPEAQGHTIQVVGLHDRLATTTRASVLFLFAGAVGLLVIALLNFSMLTAARVQQRMAEFSIRRTLGATSSRILRLAAAESAVLAVAGAALALALSHAVGPLLQNRYGTEVINDLGMGLRALAFLAVIALAAMATAGVAASRAFARGSVNQRVIVSSRLSAARAFVVAQIALSLALVVSSVLLTRSFGELSRVDPGFRTSGLYATRIALPARLYREPASRVAFWRVLEERLRTHGTVTAAVSSELPLSGQDNPTSFNAKMATGESVPVNIRSMSPGFLNLLGVPVRRGRAFTAHDNLQAPKVVLVNERLASGLSRAGDPLGQTVSFDFSGAPYAAQVVGVVRDVRHKTLATPGSSEAYFPLEQTPLLQYSLVLSGPSNERDATSLLRAALNTVDRGQPFAPVREMGEYVQRNLARSRIQAQLAALFAVVALAVAASGLYGLLAYLVAGSRREWAVRLALGASHVSLVKMVLWQSVRYAFFGVIAGVGVLVFIRTALTALLYGAVSVWDPVVVLGSAAVMAGVCVLAATIPAMRVSRISAAEVLSA